MKVRELSTLELIDYLNQEADHYEENQEESHITVTPNPDNIRAIADKIEKLNDLAYELEQNLIAAEDQNHYLQMFRKMKVENAAMKEALEFYADRDNWEYSELVCEYGNNGLPVYNTEIKNDDKFELGGKRAREVLKKLGEK